MSSIPEGIQEDIILRLPVKSILRFKSVCKNWHRLICSPKFIKDHLIRASKNPRIMIRDTNRGVGRYPFYIVDYDSISSASSSSSCKCNTVVRLNYPVSVKNGVMNCYVNIVGSCNGLLCLEAPGCHTPVLWNPSTREYKEIIPPPYNLWLPSYGFGYDSKNNDYKLVCAESNEAYVYTLKSGSWRKVVKNIPCVVSREYVGLLLNGALHWTLATAIGEISKAIVAFDISSEKFMVLAFPEEILLRPTYSTCHLQVLGDSLCIVCRFTNDRVEVWVMQNYGVRESWTKQFVTTQEKATKNPYWFNLYWYIINGDILINVGGRFGLYDQKIDRIKFMNINGLDDGYTQSRCCGEIYVESLVPLNSGTYMKRSRELKTEYISNKRRR